MKSPLWIAQREGQDWQDQNILDVIDWLRSTVDPTGWTRRMDAAKSVFEKGKKGWSQGISAPLFDPDDLIAWYIFQANAFAMEQHRSDYFEPEGFRIAPVFKRLGVLLPHLREVEGAEDRVRSLMTGGRKQPDSAIFELLVASAYKSRGWSKVSFVPEAKGIGKTPDLLVETTRKRWAVECKRAFRSVYEECEARLGKALAGPVHQLARESGRWLIVEVKFRAELKDVESDYLLRKAQDYLADETQSHWYDALAEGYVFDADPHLLNRALVHDRVFKGSSRMIELILGHYRSDFDHSIDADCEASPDRPLHADHVRRASVVSWRVVSPEAIWAKARHFRSLVGGAAKQLPGDRPGVVHVCYEAIGNNSADELRQRRNEMELRTFKPDDSRLRWVYTYYLAPEHTTNRNESWAVSETVAFQSVGGHRTSAPLPGHLLLSEDGRDGTHWS